MRAGYIGAPVLLVCLPCRSHAGDPYFCGMARLLVRVLCSPASGANANCDKMLPRYTTTHAGFSQP